MKKIVFMLMALFMSLNAFAFEFDGINLNDDAGKVTRAVSARGYVTDPERQCFKGNCQGTEIYLSFNFEDVKVKNKVGELIIDVPMKEANAIPVCTQLLNVIYHQVDKTAEGVLYNVDPDGTILILKETKDGLQLVYRTPFYYKKAKK